MNKQREIRPLLSKLLRTEQPAPAFTGTERKLLGQLRRTSVNRPVVYVGAGTCGLGAGADKTLLAIARWAEQNNQELEIVRVGCIGLCSAEPIVDIQIPGHSRISFSNVTQEKVGVLLSKVFTGEIPAEAVIGQFGDDASIKYAGIPTMAEHPFFSPQKRLVLQNCGIIDPMSVAEYIASGGYRAFIKVLGDCDPSAVCSSIEESGLRGRGGGGFPTGRKW